jgi:hypothetical protein
VAEQESLHEASGVRWKQALLWLILLVGCGSFLTLLSGLYTREPNPMFLDVAPTEYRKLQFGFPLPIFDSEVELWSSGQLYSYMLFIWVGALLDIIFYAFIVGVAFWIGSETARTIKARKS